MGHRRTIARLFVLGMSLLAAFLLPASSVLAQECGENTVPPGNSEVDQYAETVPDGCGDRPPGNQGKGNPDAVSPGTATELEQLGPDGQTALALAEDGSPGGGTEPREEGGDPEPSAVAADGKGGLGNVIGGIVDALGGGSDEGDGMGVLLPLLLLAVVIAGIGYALRRRFAG